MLIAAGCLMAGSLLLWLQFPNHYSNYLMRWEVQRYRAETGATDLQFSVDMSEHPWPNVIAVGLLLSGTALFTLGIGIYTRRHWLPFLNRIGVKGAVVLAILPALAIVTLWRPAAVHYHRLAMRSWHAQPSPRWERHQHALIALGHLQRREFPLKRRTLTNNGDFMHFVDVAPFHDDRWTFEPYADRVSVTAYHGDMRMWEDIVRRFDNAESAGPANGSQPIRSETNRTSSAAGFGR